MRKSSAAQECSIPFLSSSAMRLNNFQYKIIYPVSIDSEESLIFPETPVGSLQPAQPLHSF